MPITDLARTYDRSQPIVVINARTRQPPPDLGGARLERQHAGRDATLLIRPAKNFSEGERYIVALRNLQRRERQARSTPARFPHLPRPAQSTDPAVEERRAHMEDIFRTLRHAGIERRDLYLAWDFTVASERSLAEPHAAHPRRRLRPARRHATCAT